MKLAEIVCFDAVIPQLGSTKRDDVILDLVDALAKAGSIGKATAQALTRAVIKRETEASTGIGKGVAVPHVKYKGISEAVAAVGVSEVGIDFSSLDKQPVYSVILLVSPENGDKHLLAMETIFKHLQNEDFRKFLRQSQTVEQIKDLMIEVDENPSF